MRTKSRRGRRSVLRAFYRRKSTLLGGGYLPAVVLQRPSLLALERPKALPIRFMRVSGTCPSAVGFSHVIRNRRLHLLALIKLRAIFACRKRDAAQCAQRHRQPETSKSESHVEMLVQAGRHGGVSIGEAGWVARRVRPDAHIMREAYGPLTGRSGRVQYFSLMPMVKRWEACPPMPAR